MRWIVLVSSVLVFGSADFYDGSYFDVKNRTYAECVTKGELKNYQYLGNKETDADGIECEAWDQVLKWWLPAKKSPKDYLTTITEQMVHNKCRRVRVSNRNPFTKVIKKDPSMPVKGFIHYGDAGPWCFAKRAATGTIFGKGTPEFVPSECFRICDEKNITYDVQQPVPDFGYSPPKINYNRPLMDNIEKYFERYSMGSNSYYSWKASDETYSKGYYALRFKVFLGCLGAFIFALFWIGTCYYLKKIAVQSRQRRQRALQKMFGNRRAPKIADAKAELEMNREEEQSAS
ncbi:unnamed protein product [Caenorhabditis auriculariae]|uniref:Kringle-like domain-containing protein n=1 Tax=Caenorhabditis auriculariae TaxID=2777116 RepID=A0A8S1HJT8_9PELO|nr:unnamed protein product [Caenorhabditis auriculariae]